MLAAPVLHFPYHVGNSVPRIGPGINYVTYRQTREHARAWGQQRGVEGGVRALRGPIDPMTYCSKPLSSTMVCYTAMTTFYIDLDLSETVSIIFMSPELSRK